MKQLFTRMLFILTRCTRLLNLQNGKIINRDSIYKFKQCLDSISAVELKSTSKHKKNNFHFGSAPEQRDVSRHELEVHKDYRGLL